MSNDFLTKPVQSIKTIGPRRAAILQKAGIFTVKDLLYHFPRRYEDRTRLREAGACAHGETATLRGTVLTAQAIRPKRGLTVTKLALHDGLGVFYAVWFNQPYIKKNIPIGTKLYVTGKIERGFGAVQVMVEEYELDDGGESLSAGRLVPLYPLAGQLNQRLLRAIVKFALDELGGHTGDFLPEKLLRKFSLPLFREALATIHYPGNAEDAARARKRFIFEELFLYQFSLALCRREIARWEKAHRYLPEGKMTIAFLESLPYRLTAEQAKVWREISRDMESRFPMHRLLQGDVGSGKTVVSVLALLKAVESGLQGVLMAPTEILAEQHYYGMKSVLAPLGVEVALLTGGMRKKEKEELLERVSDGKVAVLVGTHALLQESVRFNKLGMTVVDEQHRFGVRQRAAFRSKGCWPDTLVMTATPIPRTLALTLYGDLDVSVIGELPPGRQPVKTYAVPHRLLARVYNLIREQVSQGRQAFIVCPLVEESEKVDLQAAVELAENLAAGEFRKWRVGLLHGRMKPFEKEDVMTSFRQGETKILVSTTVIEVGVDAPNATVMVILDADRFGLAQLHQLRGRVGRSAYQSYCVLVAGPKTEEGRARLKAMTRTTDGFALAEEDLRLRGPGEFYGTRQSGLPEFKIADLLADWKILQAAREEALAWISADPHLQRPESKVLLDEAKTRFNMGSGFTL
ncbi:ATP-dependent DNA helicase RecG [Pelotomaculum terephthalicicum JT]|uniref:ATP-dependent DNA helicase RecG n=1 Tax=Pelotomaculum terephthalicicum TaxID=206393 RepID=UPI001F04AE3E|nr:ATP-dependent DNA helicase RecG [Pelotomaculum terephthalicicum]MCG9969250.1 ATP-dependent DNA helicase RecG [Pelotomaculum terephthalicicum JT]